MAFKMRTVLVRSKIPGNGKHVPVIHENWTARERLAAIAMPGLLSNAGWMVNARSDSPEEFYALVASDCFSMADALLAHSGPDTAVEARGGAAYAIGMCKARMREAGLDESLLDQIPMPGDGSSGCSAKAETGGAS